MRKLAKLLCKEQSSTFKLESSSSCTSSNDKEETQSEPFKDSKIKRIKRDHIILSDFSVALNRTKMNNCIAMLVLSKKILNKFLAEHFTTTEECHK